MKRHLLYGFLFALVAAGCYQEELSVTAQTDCEGMTYTASFEDNETRTYVEDGVLLRWTAGDQISLFDGNTLNRQYKFDGETGDNSGTFSIVDAPYGSGNDLTANYAVYPYASGVKISESGVITAALPAEQTYAENSFGPGANTMVAVTKDKTDTFLRFKNVCGYLKLQLYGENVTVKSITLTGNNSEKVAGAAAITPSYSGTPTVIMAEDATGTITLDCGEGVRIGTTSETATAFWIVVPPTTFDEGFEVTITGTDGDSFTKSTSKKISIERNVVKPMAAFEVEIETIPNNQIWYTSSDGKVVAPYMDQYFGSTIKSNIYKNGKGVIEFESEVKSIGTYAFKSCSSLTGITIPNSVTFIATYAFYECSALVDVIIPESVTKINDFAFSRCSSLKNICIPSGVKSIGGDAFSQCSSLTGITIPESVTSIGNWAFYVCSSLVEIIIPDSVTNIGSNAFAHCKSLTSLVIPDSVAKIGEEVVRGCTSLLSVVVESDNQVYDSRYDCNAIIESVSNTLVAGCQNSVIPDDVIKIDNDAFRDCNTIAFINIPASVTSIGDRAFSNCTSLSRVDVQATDPPILGEYAFSTSSGLTIYVPENRVNIYKAADGWKDLNIVAGESDIVAVDLGLSVKWASCNVGATSPGEAGGYYSWGEIEEKSNYDHSTYKWSNGDDLNWKMTKYCTDSEYGTIDDKTVLDLDDDVANVKLGNGWRMPTIEEFQELFNNCTWEWTSMDGVNGYKVSGNGNSIFLPAAGCRCYDETDARYFSELGGYWSASLNDEASDAAWGFSFEETDFYEKDRVSRYTGSTIRPVKK